MTGLTEDENRLVNEIGTWLKETNSEDYQLIEAHFSHLQTLGTAVFSYPSIRDTTFLKGTIENNAGLVDSLLAFSSSTHLLHIPPKVAAIRSFLVAKFHAFSLLSQALIDRDHELLAQVRGITLSVINTLMVEAVYFSCLEDTAFSHYTKASIAKDLIALWDSGVDQRSVRHHAALASLWIARDNIVPIFGTMTGSMEMTIINTHLEADWRDFLIHELGNEETRWALEEFLFGLSWEEIEKIRFRLSKHGVNAISNDDIPTYLGASPSYSIFTVSHRNPRVIYDFFIERKDACILRKKLPAPGPKHTIEEMYLKYRIAREPLDSDNYNLLP